MSAFVVSKTHIDLLVKAADMYGRVNSKCQGSKFQWWQTNENGEYAGWYGLHPNAESMADVDGYMEFLTLTPAEVFRAIDCLDYQSCEHDGWRKSTAFAFLEALRDAACQAVDGYEDAPWGFDTIPTSAPALREP